MHYFNHDYWDILVTSGTVFFSIVTLKRNPYRFVLALSRRFLYFRSQRISSSEAFLLCSRLLFDNWYNEFVFHSNDYSSKFEDTVLSKRNTFVHAFRHQTLQQVPSFRRVHYVDDVSDIIIAISIDKSLHGVIEGRARDVQVS